MSATLPRQVLLAGVTGVLYPLCFPDFDLGFLAWVVLIPLHLSLNGAAPRRAFWLGWLAGLIAFAGVMFWVVNAMHLYGKMPLAASYVLMCLLAAHLGLYVAIYTLGVVWVRNSMPRLVFLAAPSLWVTLELIRTDLFSGLPWALLGYSQYQWLPVIQIADHTGIYGLSFLIVLVNAVLAEFSLWAIERWRGKTAGAFPWFAPGTALIVLALTLWYGQGQLRQEAGKESTRSIGIGLVQANVDQAKKWDAAYRRDVLDRHARLTAQAADNNDLLIWPEAATPFLFEQETAYREELLSLVRTYKIPLLFGSPALRRYADGRPYLLNSAYLISQDGVPVGRYDKQHLVPFGEYIPLHSSLLFFLDKLVEGIGDFEAGTVATVLSLPNKPGETADAARRAAKFGVVICYEVIFPDLVREFAENGAEFMVTITNDAWFGTSAAPYQHFGMVVFRAVENRRAFARAANTGISGFIDPQGRILMSTPIFQEQAASGRIPVGGPRTFYTKHGDVFAHACAIITGILLMSSLGKKKARGR
jgi:apolipoprotein N-acyltransferase